MSKIKFSAIIMFTFFYLKLFCQKEGDQWVIGYGGFGSQLNSVMYIDFSDAEFNLELHFEIKMVMSETNALIGNNQGQPILWTNGMEIYGKNGLKVVDSIAYENDVLSYWNWYYTQEYGPLGFPEHGGAIILPVPLRENEYSILYHLARITDNFSFDIPEYLETRVKVYEDSSYELMYKDSLFGEHEYYSGTIIATRHANGLDWWIVAFEGNGKDYFSYLLNQEGIHLGFQGELDIEMKDGVGQATFSNAGNFIARMDAINFEQPQYINLFSFDRCTGTVERIETFYTDAGYFTGVAFSPSEQYLYADDNAHLWQWDLMAENIADSQTLVDTFDGFVQPGWFGMRFGPMIAAPDGRIYIVPPAGSSEFLHVIDRPDEPAVDCRFFQHHIDLTVPNRRSAPNLPNFRLGPLDGSPCDTLGLDNVPVARWRFEEDEPGWRYDVRFTDLSFYAPQEWYWDFGDGATSDEIHPIHTFENGLYHVCLTVSNAYGHDSTCQWVEILPVSTEEFADQSEDLSIAPNPFSNRIEIRSKRGDIRTTSMTIHDMHGREMMSHPAAPVPVVLHFPAWPSGMYLVTIIEDDGKVYQFKVMKI